MACAPLPAPPAPPALPAGISLDPPLPPPPAFDEALCCKVVTLPPLPPIPPFPPGTWTGAIAAELNVIMAQVFAVIDAQPFNCPRE